MESLGKGEVREQGAPSHPSPYTPSLNHIRPGHLRVEQAHASRHTDQDAHANTHTLDPYAKRRRGQAPGLDTHFHAGSRHVQECAGMHTHTCVHMRVQTHLC